ncbi:hypothetical protein Pla144_33000 [Bythopirellula polymerisocia]|uniref:Uncharacterized protein n=1 Tax=Bythopirellula polymerisocia TaxID=2528003 RepID=A0A5C6CMD0_9BACT|nr:hypothetical protein Pla144_33000 [Bythopirellula polymerisocia]
MDCNPLIGLEISERRDFRGPITTLSGIAKSTSFLGLSHQSDEAFVVADKN